MTREQFNAKFQILNQITEGRVQTFHALSSGGAVVMAHFLGDEPAADAQKILSRIDSLEPERKSRVVKITDVDGSPVIVTKFILDFESLHRWLELEAEMGEVAASSVTQADAAPASMASAPRAAAPDEPADAAPAAADEHREPGPGEFTRVFQAPPPPAPADAVLEPEPASRPPAPEPDAEPGEFTQLFQAPPSAPAPEAALPRTAEAEAEAEPGEFTQLFQAARDPVMLPAEAPPPSAPPRHPTREAAAPGEFTRMFQTPAPGGAPAPPPSPAPSLHAAGKPEIGDASRSIHGAVQRVDHLVEMAADLRLPESRRVDLPSASPSVPGLNLHTPPSAPAGMPETPPPGGDSVPNPPPPPGGEFTRIFGQASSTQSHDNRFPASRPAAPRLEPRAIEHVAAQARDAHDYAERLKGLAGSGSQPGSPTGSAAPPPSAPVAMSGAGEYTRIITAQTPPAPAPQQAPPPIPAQPALGAESGSTTTKWPLIVGLALVLPLVLALVLYFALRTAP
jgi:hypothetical protein